MELKLRDFLLRPATNHDMGAIKDVVFTILKEYNLPYGDSSKDGDLNDIEKNYFAPGGFFGVVVDSKSQRIVGTFGLAVYDDRVFELRKMYVNKSYQGHGLGKWMLDTAKQIAIQKGYKKIFLETISPLKVAITMYKQFGFKEVPIKEVSNRVDQAFELDIV